MLNSSDVTLPDISLLAVLIPLFATTTQFLIAAPTLKPRRMPPPEALVLTTFKFSMNCMGRRRTYRGDRA